MTDNRPPKDKKSWREIDSRRDKPREAAPSGRGGSIQARLQEEQKSKQYRAALDALFEKGGFDRVAKVLGREEPTPEPAPPAVVAATTEATARPAAKREPAAPSSAEVRFALRKKIVEAVGRDEISRALDKYLGKGPLPDDFEVLEQALEHTAEARIDEAVSRLHGLLERERPRRARTLTAKLRYLEETAKDFDLRTRAGEVRRRLG